MKKAPRNKIRKIQKHYILYIFSFLKRLHESQNVFLANRSSEDTSFRHALFQDISMVEHTAKSYTIKNPLHANLLYTQQDCRASHLMLGVVRSPSRPGMQMNQLWPIGGLRDPVGYVELGL